MDARTRHGLPDTMSNFERMVPYDEKVDDRIFSFDPFPSAFQSGPGRYE